MVRKAPVPTPNDAHSMERFPYARRSENTYPEGQASAQWLDIASAPLPGVVIRCLGPLQICIGTHPIQFWGSRKASELLAFLATQPYGSAGRDEVIDALWPDRPVSQADQLLNSTVWKVRSTLDSALDALRVTPGLRGTAVRQSFRKPKHSPRTSPRHSVLLTGQRCYALNADRCSSDLTDVYRLPEATEAAIAQGTLPDVAATWLGLRIPEPSRLLTGEPFDWITAARQGLGDVQTAVLSRALACANRDGDEGSALQVLHRLLILDPLAEDIVARTMRLHLARGESAAAAQCYATFRRAVRQQYADEDDTYVVSRELRELYARVTARAEPHAKPRPDASSPK